eukprot:2198195-Alexandrium_andersonii.AAC.1
MLIAARRVSASAWTQSGMREALADVQRSEWQLTDAQAQHWRNEMGGRLRTALRHIAQALCKAKPPAWAAAFAFSVDSQPTEPSSAANMEGDTIDGAPLEGA